MNTPILTMSVSKERNANTMRTVRPQDYVALSQNADEVHVTLYDLRPHPDARLQIVAGIRLDGIPLGLVFTRERRIKVWANWDTVIPHFQKVLQPRRKTHIHIETGVLPEEDAEAFRIPPAFKDKMLALGPRDLREEFDGLGDAPDSRDA